MKQWIKKHRTITWISSILIVCIIGGFLWLRDKQITEAKQDIQYANRLLSEFHQQKTLYEKVDFLLHKLPDSDKDSPFCMYGYDKDFQDNGWREANPITIRVSTTLDQYNNNGYEVEYLTPLSSKDSPQHKKNICSLLIENESNNQKSYRLYINNNWNIIEYDTRENEHISKDEQDKLLNIGKKEVNLLFKTVEKNIQQYKERAENTLKYYHADDK